MRGARRTHEFARSARRAFRMKPKDKLNKKIKSQQPTNFSFTLSKFRLLWQTAKKARRSHPKSSKQINPRTKSFFHHGRTLRDAEGVSVHPVVKIPRQILTLQNILKLRTNHNFLSLIANGDSPQNYFVVKNPASNSHLAKHPRLPRLSQFFYHLSPMMSPPSYLMPDSIA